MPNSRTDKQQPLVSVVINVFNGEKYICQAIESVVSQTYSNWELIIWDNRSTDATSTVVSQYKDHRISYYLAPTHTSLATARAHALRLTQGVWIGFLDADDFWLPHKLEHQIELTQAISPNKVSMVYSHSSIFGDSYPGLGESKLLKTLTLPAYRTSFRVLHHIKALSYTNYISFPATLYSTHELKSIASVSHTSLSPDYFWNLYFHSRNKVLYSKQIVCGYRHHSGNLSKTKQAEMLQESLSILETYNDTSFNHRYNTSGIRVKYLMHKFALGNQKPLIRRFVRKPISTVFHVCMVVFLQAYLRPLMLKPF